nr:HD-GYP domain-containing protein [Actinomycetota bacterium]
MARREPLRDPPEPRRRQEGDEKVVLRRREADWTGEERSSPEETDFAVRRAAVDVAAAALAAHDGFTARHSDDVVTLCGALVRRLGLSELQRVRLLAAASLHDLGKVAVPQAVLDKPGPLDCAEWALIHDHTLCGQRILESVPELSEVGHIVRHSHERWDGAGYPDGLAREEIPLESRIVFCADAFHAMRCDRPYRAGRSAAEALEELRRHSGTQFDPTVVEALEQEANLLRGSPSARLAAMTSTLRSKRLVALLLSLVVSGSALAAPGSPFGEGGGGREALASTPAGCAEPCVRGSIGALAASQGAAAAAADPRDRGED